MSFLDGLTIKECSLEKKDKSLMPNGCRKFVIDHINDCEKILSKMEEVHLRLSGQKSIFGVPEILIVGHMCGTYRSNHLQIEENVTRSSSSTKAKV